MNADIPGLRSSVFELVETSRRQLEGGMVDLSPVEEAVREYCTALSALPLDEARAHADDLRSLMEEMGRLEEELQRARFVVQQRLTELGRAQKADAAYRKTDGIGEVYYLPEGDGGEG